MLRKIVFWGVVYLVGAGLLGYVLQIDHWLRYGLYVAIGAVLLSGVALAINVFQIRRMLAQADRDMQAKKRNPWSSN